MFCFFCQNNNKASKTIIDGGVDFAGACGLCDESVGPRDLGLSGTR